MPSGFTDQEIGVPSSPVVSQNKDIKAIIEIKPEEMQSTQQAQTSAVNEMVEKILPKQKDIRQIEDSVTEKDLEQSAMPKGLTDQEIQVPSSPVVSKHEDEKSGN